MKIGRNRETKGREKPKWRKVSRSMDPEQRKKAAMPQMMQQLRAITNSSAMNEATIIVDAIRCIEELMQKVEELNSELKTAESSMSHDKLPMVTVKTLEKGFLIYVFSEKNCPGLLVAIFDAIEELGLDVLDARVSCEDTFQLEAIGECQQHESTDPQVVKHAVLKAIKNMD